VKGELFMLTTREVMESLSVSRYWVDTHLRHLGIKGADDPNKMEDLIKVYYSEDEIIEWLNENARFTRRTYNLDLCDYTSEDVAKRESEKVISMPMETIGQIDAYIRAGNNLIASLVGEEASKYASLLNPRRRSKLKWVEVDYNIEKFSDLITIKQLMKMMNYRSPEMCYRYIYLSGMIRCEVRGRSYYMYAPEKPVCGILMPEEFRSR